jgi:LysM repeat protein
VLSTRLRPFVVPAALAVLAACGGTPPPAPAPEPEAVEEGPGAAVAEPDFSLAERLRSPFAVRSSGRAAPRVARSVVAAGGAAAPPADTARAAAPAQPPAAAARPPAAAATTTPPGGTAAAPASRPPAASRAPTTHEVGSGETFLAVARRYGVTYTQLLNANPGIDPDRIRPGQTLRLPAGATAPSAGARPATADAPAPARPAARRTHTVVQGETLWSISRRYGVPAEQIRTANQLQGDNVRIGQTLVIPSP